MRLKPILATVIFAALLYGFWTQVVATGLADRLGGHLISAFTCFALLLAVLWFFGFQDRMNHVGTGALARSSRAKLAVILAPALLAIPYAIFSIPRGEFHFTYFLGLALLPVALSALIELSNLPPRFTWQDFVALFGIAVILELRFFSGAWPYAGLGSLPKL